MSRLRLALPFIVILTACTGTPSTPAGVAHERDASAASAASTAHVATAPDAGSSTCEPSTPEAATLCKCDATDPQLAVVLDSARDLADKGPIADRALVDALWSCFDRFRPSKAKASKITLGLIATVLAVKDASYAPKAIAKLSTPVYAPGDRDEHHDKLFFWLAPSVRLLGDLRDPQAVRPLVSVLLDDKKEYVVYPIAAALAKMPKDAEPVLIAALAGTDPELAKLADKSEEDAWRVRVAHGLAALSRPAGRDAIVDALPKMTNDKARAMLALDLTRFPPTARSTAAFREAFAKIPPELQVTTEGGIHERAMDARAMLASAAPSFFDPSMIDWLLKVKDTVGRAHNLDDFDSAAVPASIELMTAPTANKVAAALNGVSKQKASKQTFDNALALLNECKKSAACYVKELQKPLPASHSPSDRIRHLKAARMAGIHGDGTTRAALVDRLAGIQDQDIRRAMLAAIDHLSPNGDAAVADKLEALVATERASNVLVAHDEMVSVAIRLRSRAL